EAYAKLANLATKAGVEGEDFKIHAPLLHLDKAEIIREGLRYDIDYSLTFSCYDKDSEGKACGVCESCQYRAEGFKQAEVVDPTVYRD
ncbi:MAG: 7-cyano-7-deazaguanine synthase, partial [Gammaproteobacteria bacterium]